MSFLGRELQNFLLKNVIGDSAFFISRVAFCNGPLQLTLRKKVEGLAERGGFEPPVQLLTVRRFSNRWRAIPIRFASSRLMPVSA